ncbi:exportin-6 [Caerostris extrusa]|uniref:Exportin-6 n=1 Tax=Caerostris extrusa TaxID=172846 RepID=A0AAV4P058_CAEEX|nr:exportin-6 [Caerostris extrusa]
MGCINEIMSKHCIPADYEGFLLQVFQDTFHLLQNLTKDNTKNASRNILAEVDDVYVEKFTDFLMLFVIHHLKRFESNAQFPILEFLALLFKYTFQQPTLDGFYSCLDVWNVFLDYLSYKLKNENNNYEMTLNKYKDVLLALSQEILRKLQFRYNQSDLEELDDEDLNDDCFTEWQSFLCQCLEIVSKVSELLPIEIFHLVFSIFEENLRIYFDLEQFLKPSLNNSPLELNVCGENECRRLHCSLRDLSSMLQALGRLVVYMIKTAAPLVLKVDFIEVHAQILATLKAFCYWLTQYVKETKDGNSESSIEKIIAEIAIANIKKRKTQIVVYRSMSNVLVLPWNNVAVDAQQLWPIRSSQHDLLIQSLCEPLRTACSRPNFFQDKLIQERSKPDILWVLQVMCGLIENVSDGSTRTKQVFYKSLQSTISFVESLFHLYLQHSDVTESILEFYLCSSSQLFGIQSRPSICAKNYAEFLDFIFHRKNQVMEFTLNESSSGCKVIEKLLQLLQQVVQEPSSHFKAFLPSTIELCLGQIYPFIAERPSSEVKPPLFELLHNILLHNYRYFFKVNVVNSLGESGNEKIENEQHFTKIMEAYGQSFLQPDIVLFKQNLFSLETLNNKWKLFYKGYFKSVMLFHFLSLLLKTLIYRTHNLLKEEIISTIYNMALVDFNCFYTVFLQQFLQSMENLDTNQKSSLLRNFKRDTDLHSFAESIQRFVSDLRYYCLCTNTSL